jgi:hypothetical protein
MLALMRLRKQPAHASPRCAIGDRSIRTCISACHHGIAGRLTTAWGGVRAGLRLRAAAGREHSMCGGGLSASGRRVNIQAREAADSTVYTGAGPDAVQKNSSRDQKCDRVWLVCEVVERPKRPKADCHESHHPMTWMSPTHEQHFRFILNRDYTCTVGIWRLGPFATFRIFDAVFP